MTQKLSDDQLADLTDAVLDRRDPQVTPELRDFGELAVLLRDVIRPDSEPPEALRERLGMQMAHEFDALSSSTRNRRRALTTPLRIALAAASVALVLLAILLFDAADVTQSLSGAAAGIGDVGSLALGVLLVSGAGLIALLVVRRR